MDKEKIYAGLSPYQRATVRHLEEVYQRRSVYLVADEVGLGKTFVARSLIRALDANRVLYIASNPQIAGQNVEKLVGDGYRQVTDVDRLSMLLRWMERPEHSNWASSRWILPLSPATTFTGTGSKMGDLEERAYYIQCLYGGRAPTPSRLLSVMLEALKTQNVNFKDEYEPLLVLRQESSRGPYLFPVIRAFFNDMAAKQFAPDLIILDEFHRFHQIFDTAGQHYPLRHMLSTLPAARDKKPAKLLLLSATPYKMPLLADPVIIREEEPYTDEGENSFQDFSQLRRCMLELDLLSGGTAAPSPPEKDYDALYQNVLCRTERSWLLGSFPPAGFQDLAARPQRDNGTIKLDMTPVKRLVRPHLAYRLAYQQEALGGLPGLCAAPSNQEQSDALAEVLGLCSALTGYSSITTFLDEAPEFLQFCDGYASIQGGKAEATGDSAAEGKKEEATRTRFCELLRKQNGYRLRRGDNGEPCPGFCRDIGAHYKFSLLLEHAMPEGCELLLWVPPTATRNTLPFFRKHPELRDFAKTLVFTHYRMSTRSVAALSSMEAQRRLLECIGSTPILEAGPLDCKALCIPGCASCEVQQAIQTFFTTTHALRVLTAYGKRFCPQLLDRGLACVVKQYCTDFGWFDALREYLEEGPARQQCTRLREVLNWSDGDRTRVLVLPDWSSGDGYPCTFGERYTADYSDKGAHDTGAKKSPVRHTSKRLSCIRNRFLSPFYPFILAASESAQEGVDLHSYCQTLFHWSAPTTLNSMVQEDGRVDRHKSLAIRRQAVWLYEQSGLTPRDLGLTEPVTPAALLQRDTALKICGRVFPAGLRELADSGLFPAWYLPQPQGAGEDFPRLRRVLAALPASRDQQVFEALLDKQEKYGQFIQALAGSGGPRGLCPLFRTAIRTEG